MISRESEASLDAVLGALRSLEAAAIPGVTELAPAYSTVGVFFDPARIESFDALKTEIEQVLHNTERSGPRAGTGSAPIEIPVCYERRVRSRSRAMSRWHAGLSAQEVIRRHSTAAYRVTCVGFIAGLSVSERIASGARDAAARFSAQGSSGGLGRDRRRANRDLSAKFARRLEPDRAHAVVACSTCSATRLRFSRPEIASVFARFRGKNSNGLSP